MSTDDLKMIGPGSRRVVSATRAPAAPEARTVSEHLEAAAGDARGGARYTPDTVECIDAMEVVGANYTSFAVGHAAAQAVKYLWRAERKNGLDDFDKALDYLKRAREAYATGTPAWVRDAPATAPTAAPAVKSSAVVLARRVLEFDDLAAGLDAVSDDEVVSLAREILRLAGR